MISPSLAYRPVGPEAERWEWQARAWRILYGHWRADLYDRIAQSVGEGRADAWGAPDIGSNLLLSAAGAVSTLYDHGWHVYHDDSAAAEVLADAFAAAQWQPVAQRNQRDTIAIREHLIRVDVIDDDDGRRLTLTPVPPHTVEVIADPRDPTRPVAIKWWRLRTNPAGHAEWTCDVTDTREGMERYAIESDGGRDVSAVYLRGPDGEQAPVGGFVGPAYPYRSAGRPILPWVIYHAGTTGQLWDYQSNAQIVDATLTIGVLWTYWRHLVQTASWPQRYLIGGVVGGQGMDGEGAHGRRTVVADPAVLLTISPDGDSDRGPTIHQDATNADPKALQEAIRAYEHSKIGLAGLNPADVVRSSGDPRSGYAMAITRDGQREAQRRYAPVFRLADQHLCRIAAALLGGLPLDGYRVSYDDIPLTVGEQIEMQRFVDAEIAAGRMSALQAYAAMHPELAPEDAEAHLAAIQSLTLPEDQGALLVGQMTTLIDIVRETQAGTVPRDAALAMIGAILRVDDAQAARLLGSAGLAPIQSSTPPTRSATRREDDDDRPDRGAAAGARDADGRDAEDPA